jgi:hypothetical protein
MEALYVGINILVQAVTKAGSSGTDKVADAVGDPRGVDERWSPSWPRYDSQHLEA